VQRDLSRVRSRRAVFAFLSIFLWAPCALVLGVEHWLPMVALFTACIGMAGLVALNARSGRVPVPLLLLGNLVVALAFSRLASPFVITPMLVCGQVLALSTHRDLDARRWLVFSWMAAALLLPIALETLGVLAPTWRVVPGGVMTWSTILRPAGNATFFALTTGQLALGTVVTLYAASFARAGLDAQRRAHRQAWHLRQALVRR
jgi:hypothetical protein